MPICKNCDEEFPDSYNYRASIRDFSKRKYCVKCRSVGAHRHTNRREISECLVCSKPLTGHQRKFCSKKCKTHALSSYPQQKQRRFIRKLELIKMAGGACASCGYSRNTAAFHFHHLDPSKKQLPLDSTAIVNRPLQAILEEFANCILLCANCHAELHNPNMDYEKLKKAFEGVEVY